MNNLITKYSILVFSYYLVLLPNFIKETAGCQLNKLLDNNIIAKHITGIILTLCYAVLISPDYSNNQIFTNIIITLIAYFWFILSSRCNVETTLITLTLLLISYVANSAKAKYEKDNNQEYIDISTNIRNMTGIAAFGVTIVGVVLYYLAKQKEYGPNFSLLTFLIGTINCNNN